ncbi:MAG: acyltransferase [Acidobacteria bacterium]|nr:acyltransferase [Acidobacteriota bacterium]
MKNDFDPNAGRADWNAPFGHLRMFVTLMVVAHHAVLAYLPMSPPPATSLDPGLYWAAFPIVDSAKWKGIELFVTFNDTFFMSLMFLISGLFVWPALRRKGTAAFLRDRALKLGVTFVVGAGLLAPLAYSATYAAIDAPQGSFWSQWLSIGKWPAGPAWFLWVLLAFGCAAALVHALAPSRLEAFGRIAGRFGERPALFFVALVLVSSIGYLPMAAAFNPMEWFGAGPFFVQTSRVAHYAIYFIAGVALGAFGVNRGLLSTDGRLARRWPLWIATSLVLFAVAITTWVIILSTIPNGGPGLALRSLGNFAFTLTCAATSLAFVAIALRFARRSNAIADSLGANAFGIYLVHYACTTWLQFALLDVPLSGAAKGSLVFLSAVVASWLVSALLGRIPVIGRILGNARPTPTSRTTSPGGLADAA